MCSRGAHELQIHSDEIRSLNNSTLFISHKLCAEKCVAPQCKLREKGDLCFREREDYHFRSQQEQKSWDIIRFDVVGKFSWSFVMHCEHNKQLISRTKNLIELNNFHSGWYFLKRFVHGDTINHFIYGFGCTCVFFFKNNLLFWIFKISQRLQCWVFSAKLKFTDLWESERELCSDWSLTWPHMSLSAWSCSYSLEHVTCPD